MTAKKSTEKRDARAELLFCQFKPIAFFSPKLRLRYSQNRYTDAEEATESVRIERVEFRETLRVFFPQGQSKLSVIMRSLY